jgi:hypothetical protein
MIYLKLFDKKYVVTLNGIISCFVFVQVSNKALGEAATPSSVDIS